MIRSGDHLLWHAALVDGRRQADFEALAAFVEPLHRAFAQAALAMSVTTAAFVKAMRDIERALAASRAVIRPTTPDRIPTEPASVPSREASVALRLSDPRTPGPGS